MTLSDTYGEWQWAIEYILNKKKKSYTLTTGYLYIIIPFHAV